MVRKRALMIRINPLLFQFKTQKNSSGNEEAAFEGFWKPGGQTFPGNMPEVSHGRSAGGKFTIRK